MGPDFPFDLDVQVDARISYPALEGRQRTTPDIESDATPMEQHSFGDFRLAGWQEQNLVRCDLSAYNDELNHLYFGWMTPEDRAFVHHNWFGFICHRLVAPRFQASFGKIVGKGLHRSLKTFDGCFNPSRKDTSPKSGSVFSE
ncbi:MAG: hypothetical protein C4B58_07400 [Deltaproteobacteria bacterium]|nr:MAG: hypothetical protein C4B58_07400 [Deltaproteobacteria bacterium]